MPEAGAFWHSSSSFCEQSSEALTSSVICFGVMTLPAASLYVIGKHSECGSVELSDGSGLMPPSPGRMSMMVAGNWQVTWNGEAPPGPSGSMVNFPLTTAPSPSAASLLSMNDLSIAQVGKISVQTSGPSSTASSALRCPLVALKLRDWAGIWFMSVR